MTTTTASTLWCCCIRVFPSFTPSPIAVFPLFTIIYEVGPDTIAINFMHVFCLIVAPLGRPTSHNTSKTNLTSSPTP